ncbi:hypothetical protein KC865_03370 [Candidatus Kaiserbacteria bacterium]|nr:hypothetical protein [Candidatus Kaiserbacteria bacterium]USN92604.1 MAG: hypothetical protein H6782_02200 [Candidatus Nomurabacteria bacterium]
MSKATIRNLVISLILIASALTVFGLMVFQVRDQGNQLIAQMESLREEQSQVGSYIALQRISEKSADDRNLLKSYFLSQESDSIYFLNQVESLAPQVGVEIRTSGLGTVQNEKEEVEWIKVTFSFSGSRERVERFIKILENYPLLSRINSVNFLSRSGGEWEASVNMQVRVTAYGK